MYNSIDDLIISIIIVGLISGVSIVFILNRFVLNKNNSIGENNKIIKKNIIGPALIIFPLLIPVFVFIWMLGFLQM